MTRLRWDAALYDPAPPRKPGQNGPPRKKGARRPTGQQVLADPHTRWTPITVNPWYGGGVREVEVCTDTAVWYHAGLPPVTIRWVLIRNPQDAFDTQAQVQAQLTLLDSARRAEQPDPQWASTAQLALHEALQSKAVAGLQVREMDCRTTLCRAELFLDGSASPEAIFRDLVHLALWQGQGFVHFKEGGSAVVYLAREGYALPQASE